MECDIRHSEQSSPIPVSTYLLYDKCSVTWADYISCRLGQLTTLSSYKVTSVSHLTLFLSIYPSIYLIMYSLTYLRITKGALQLCRLVSQPDSLHDSQLDIQQGNQRVNPQAALLRHPLTRFILV